MARSQLLVCLLSGCLIFLLLITILFVDNLVQIQLTEVNEMVTTNLYRFYGLVKALLPRDQAASSLGMIARLGGAAFGDAFIDYEVEMALNTIIQNERSRQSAILILTELAKNSPGNFYRHVELVLEQVWVPLRDMRVSSEFRHFVAFCLHRALITLHCSLK